MKPFRPLRGLALGAIVATSAACTSAQRPAPQPAPQPAQQPSTGQPAAQQEGQPAAGAPQRRGPRPYAQVITARAVTDRGGITSHRVDDRWFLEIPDSVFRRDMLLVTRVAGVPTGFDGFVSAGSSIEERLVRFERQGDRVVLRSFSADAYADDSLAIATSVASNNVGAILGAFPVQATAPRDSAVVVDVTEFLSGDTPALSGLTAEQRRRYQVRRLDPSRSFVSAVRAFPMNVEVRHTQTYDAGEPPGDRTSGSLSLEMRQSLVLLPRTPMRPRYADERVGFFSVQRVNYGLDEQKAAQQRFIRRWRLEPKDPAAYARGELVEPVKPIAYYLDPATPPKWRRYVKQGVEDWQKVFEKAGFRNAIVALEAPTPQQDPEWDPEDIRYSVVRWAASTVRNAVGPSTSDPRTGEIIESDITWYHNHMRSYRNRLMVETAAANPAARTLDIPEELMGETMRQVIAHEVGHALGLPHNMVASSSFPVDSLRSKSFTNRYGVSATIMDYARQNYVAQPGDGLAPKDFIRRLGPWDDFVIEWGYRVHPQAATPEAERPALNRMLVEQKGPMPYRYVPQPFAGIDPRSQTEDLGDDPIRASTYALANMKRVLPNLVAWTTAPGKDYEDLAELYGEATRMYSLYTGHVAAMIGGVMIDAKTAEQGADVYRPVPKARQQAALRWLADNALRTQEWLAPEEITSRIGPTVGPSNAMAVQQNVLANLLSTPRLSRMVDGQVAGGDPAWGAAEYLEALRGAVFAGPPDATERALHRVHVERLAALVEPPAPPAAAPPGAPPQPPGPQLPPLLQPVNVQRTDLPALARLQLRAIRAEARSKAAAAGGVQRAHWLDIAERAERVLEPKS